jgi:hypothetical protein
MHNRACWEKPWNWKEDGSHLVETNALSSSYALLQIVTNPHRNLRNILKQATWMKGSQLQYFGDQSRSEVSIYC